MNRSRTHRILCACTLLALISGCDDFATENVVIGVNRSSSASSSTSTSSSSGGSAPLDDDADGLSNDVELTFGISNRVADTDFDGFGDGLEFVGNAADPLDSRAIPLPLNRTRFLTPDQAVLNDLDRDQDGLGDSFENAVGLDPEDPDFDDDGYHDGLELVAGSDPFRADSRPQRAAAPVPDGIQRPDQPPLDRDNDGISDEREELNGTFTNNRDSDGDGYSDGIELLMGSNPLEPLSIPAFNVPQPPA